MSQRKATAGGHIRTSLDNTWGTPERELDAVRAYGPIGFDPFSAPSNPTKAAQFCAAPPGTMFAGKHAERLFEQIALSLDKPVPGEFISANGLEVCWSGRGLVFTNPPYGRELRPCLKKLIAEATSPARPEIITLLFATRQEMPYMQRLLRVGNAVCYPIGRIAFISSFDGVPVRGTPFASHFLGFNVDPERFSKAFDPLGLVQFTSVAP